jgi:hypothetical protein
MSNVSRTGPAYGTTDENGEPISVKGHLTELEVILLPLLILIE